MRSKKPVICFKIFLIGASIFCGSGSIANEIPDFIELDQDVYKSNRKGPVPFEHEMHAEDYEVACDECHHIFKEGKNVWKEGDPVQRCVACHDPSKSEGDVKKLRLAFHKNCKGCHRKLKKEGISEDAPYRKCTDCHRKKS
jgi:hypothetical protein